MWKYPWTPCDNTVKCILVPVHRHLLELACFWCASWMIGYKKRGIMAINICLLVGSMFTVAIYQVHLWRKYVFTFYAVFLKFCGRYLLLAFLSHSCLHLSPEADYLDFFSKPMGFEHVGKCILYHMAIKLVPDVFSDPCLKNLLLAEDESLFSYEVKTVSSWGIWFYRIYFLLPEGKKNRACKSVDDLIAFENLSAL